MKDCGGVFMTHSVNSKETNNRNREIKKSHLISEP